MLNKSQDASSPELGIVFRMLALDLLATRRLISAWAVAPALPLVFVERQLARPERCHVLTLVSLPVLPADIFTHSNTQYAH